MKRKKVWYLIISFLLVLLLNGCSGIMKNHGESLGNTDGNLQQRGLVASDGKWIYYKFKGNLYKSKLDGSEKTMLYSIGEVKPDLNQYLWYINVRGDWVYFAGKNNETGTAGLYKIKKDGTDIQRLVSDTYANEVYVIGDKIYYDRDYVLSCDGDGSDKQRINAVETKGYIFNISDGYMYWQEEDAQKIYHVYRRKLDGTDEQEIDERRITYAVVDDGWIYYEEYYRDEGVGLMKMRVDGTDRQNVMTNGFDKYNVKDGWIYYYDSGEDKATLWKIKTDGTEQQELFTVELTKNESTIGVYTVGDWIYCYSENIMRRVKNDGTGYSVVFDERMNENQEESEQTPISDVGSEVLPTVDTDTESNTETETIESEEIESEPSSMASIDEDDLTLNNTYETRFEDVMLVTYPKFAFDFPSSWDLTTNIDENGETAVVTSSRGVTVTYTHMSGFKRENLLSDGSTIMLRVEATKVGDSSFVPSYVQATDYSYLGNFVVAKLKVTGQLNMKSDSDFTDVDGTVCYAVIPESQLGTHDSVRSQYCVEFGYDYSGIISLIAEAAPGESFSEAEEKAVIKMLESYRVVE